MHRLTVGALIAITAISALHARAAELSFSATSQGQLVQSRVCAYPAAETESFLYRQLTTDRVRCFPAESVALDSGWWNFYLITDRLTSDHPISAHLSLAPQKRPLHSTVQLVESAVVDFSRVPIEPGDLRFVYLDNIHRNGVQSALRPVTSGEITVAVPGGSNIIPLIVRNGTIHDVGTRLQLRAGERGRADFPRGPGVTVIVPLTLVEGLTDDQIAALIRSPSPPTAILEAADRAWKPELPIRQAPEFNRSLLIFRNVPPGNHRLQLSGNGWKIKQTTIRISRREGVIVENPMVAEPALTVGVSWNVSDELNLDRREECEFYPVETPSLMINLRRCPDDRWVGNEPPCKILEQREITGTSGQEFFELPAMNGELAVELKRGTSLSIAKYPVFGAGHLQVDASATAGLINGKITRGGKPTKARVAFRTTSAVSDEITGMYTAVYGIAPEWSSVYLNACDGAWTYRYIPTSNMSESSVLDIDVPDNSIDVRVLDSGTADPISGASVTSFTLGGPGADLEMSQRRFPATDEQGQTKTVDHQPEISTTICASAPGYEQKCLEDQKIAATGVHAVDFNLSAVGFTEGVIAGGGGAGARVWLAKNGQILEGAEADAGGRFRLRGAPPGALLVVRLAGGMLFGEHVEHILDPSGNRLEVQPPVAMIQDVEISNHSGSIASLSLSIGGRTVPQSLMNFVVSTRQLHAGERTYVRNFGNTTRAGELVVYLNSRETQMRALGVSDLFNDARARQLLTYFPLPGSGGISIQE